MKLRTKWTGWLLAMVAGLVGACPRKAPGPDECHALSLSMLGVDERIAAKIPSIERAAGSLTIACLTIPFDRELVSCMEHRTPALGRRSLQVVLDCLTLPDDSVMSECVLRYGPGQACFAEFLLRRER